MIKFQNLVDLCSNLQEEYLDMGFYSAHKLHFSNLPAGGVVACLKPVREVLLLNVFVSLVMQGWTQR